MRFNSERKNYTFPNSLPVCFFSIVLASLEFIYAAPTKLPVAPVFVKSPNLTEVRTVPVSYSSSTKLDCSVRRRPKNTVKWYEVVSNVTKQLIKTNTFTLTLKKVTKDAKYMCNVSNAAGFRTRTFKLKVFEFMLSKPLVPDLTNVTVKEGETAELFCNAAGDALPHFKFYKWTNESSFKSVHELEDLRDRIKVYTKPAQQKTEFFKHYLTIYNTTPADAGRYTCAAGNSKGIAKKDTYLTVKEDGASSDSVYSPSGLESWQFPVIGISVALFVFLAIIVLVFAYRQRLHRKLAKKEEEIREMCEQEAKSLYQSPVHRFLTVNSARSSSGSVTSDTLLRGNLVSCGDEFAHVSIPLDKKWEIDREHLRIDGELGEGAFGRVLKATAVGVPGLPPKHTVAIKTLKENSTEGELADLLSEMNMMKNIGKHKNIVNLIGCCTQTGPLYMVIEYAEFGNLRQYLRDRRPTQSEDVETSAEEVSLTEERHKNEGVISMSDLVSFAFQIARGMEYLESKKCVHRDLAARNILVSEGRILKIADFGLARDIHAMDYYRKTTDGRLPVKWMAIEALFDRVYSSKSDVWGFGVVLWEIMTFGGTPYPSLPVEGLFELLQSGYRMEKPINCPQNIYDTMLSCWQENPVNRPSFSNLVRLFDNILTSLLSSEYLETDSPDGKKRSSGANDATDEEILCLTASSSDSVFEHSGDGLLRKQSNSTGEETGDGSHNISSFETKQKSQVNVKYASQEYAAAEVTIQPSFSYEVLSGTAGPRESEV